MLSMISSLLSIWIEWWLPPKLLDNREHHKVTLFVTRDFGILGRQREARSWGTMDQGQNQDGRNSTPLESPGARRKESVIICALLQEIWLRRYLGFKLLASTAVKCCTSVFCLKALICCTVLWEFYGTHTPLTFKAPKLIIVSFGENFRNVNWKNIMVNNFSIRKHVRERKLE